MALFDSLKLIQNSKFNNFLWVCCFLGKNLSDFVSPNENSITQIAILFILLFFSRDRNYGIPLGLFTHMHHFLYSCWVFLQLYLGQFSVLRFLPIQTFMVYMKQQLHQLVPKILPYQVIYHTILFSNIPYETIRHSFTVIQKKEKKKVNGFVTSISFQKT